MRALVVAMAIALPAPAFVPGAVADPGAAVSAYNAGNDRFDQGNFAGAVEDYERALEAGARDARLEFNLGTTHARLGQWGKARLHLERAVRLDPLDEDARRNLALVIGQIPGEALPLEAGALSSVVSRYRAIAPGTIAWTTLALWTLFWVLWATELQWPSLGERTAVQGAKIALAAFVVAGGLVFYSKVHERSRELAVIVGEPVAVRAEPEEDARDVGRLVPGQLVESVRQRGAWVEVRREGELEGWIAAAHVAPLDF